MISIAVWQGLGAPVGTMLGGSKDFIQRAVRARKALGGGMRQTGILAAAGRISLSDLIGRLEEDHRNTKRFAQGDRTPTEFLELSTLCKYWKRDALLR